MTHKEKWAIVESIGWGTKTTDSEKVQEWLSENYSGADLRELEEFCEDKVGQIHAILRYKWLDGTLHVGWLGDDSFHDLCCEVIGRGEQMFKDVAISQNVPAGFKINENFMYCFLGIEEECP